MLSYIMFIYIDKDFKCHSMILTKQPTSFAKV